MSDKKEKNTSQTAPLSADKGETTRPAKHLLLQLFLSTLTLSAFTFGGGYVIVTLMKKKFVDEYHWIDEEEMLDLVAIAQSAPGAIAVNGAIVVGFKLAGIAGLLVSVLATVLPPFVILSVISLFYEAFASNEIVALALAGMQAGVGAVIASVVYDMGSGVVKSRDWLGIFLMAVVFVLNYFLNVNVMLLIIACGLLGVVRTLLESKREKGGEAS
ncbi:MAG TPA: chromate transporter [Candidatus Pullilachnospira intestinigallinarum]|nr:chromate transporter [Candidatus Pullilachnospira intestinigallinarum]